MYESKTHSVKQRIMSIQQPHVRPIVRGKSTAKVKFCAKIYVWLVDDFAFSDEISWDAFNQRSHMMIYVENYKKRFGYYPKEIFADGLLAIQTAKISTFRIIQLIRFCLYKFNLTDMVFC